MKKYTIVIATIFIVAVIFLIAGKTANTITPIALTRYVCDDGKYINAAFYDGSTAPAPAPGQPPLPTGTAEVSLDGIASTTLHQTRSAVGARYANDDESFVFWNKGNEALIMRNNQMDLDYKNCTDRT